MKKGIIISTITVLVLIILLLFVSTGSKDTKIEKIYLSDKYYNEGLVTDITSEEIENLKDDSYLLFTYNNYCGMAKPCEQIFESVLAKYNIDLITIPIAEFRKTDFSKTVKYAPSLIVINKGKIVAFLDAEDDSQLKYYQEETDFEKWLGKYIYFEK